MEKVISITEQGILVREVSEISSSTLHDICEGQSLELSLGRFSDPTVLLYTREMAEYLPSVRIYCVLRDSQKVLYGKVVICGSSGSGQEIGLTDDQIELVKRELYVLDESVSPQSLGALEAALMERSRNNIN